MSGEPTSTPPDRLSRIEERLNAATPGPWYVVGPPWNEGAPWINAGNEDPHGGRFVCDFCDYGQESAEQPNSEADAALIAHAPDDFRALLAIAKAAEEAVRTFYRDRPSEDEEAHAELRAALAALDTKEAE